jgi:hypothetical protein
MRKWIINDEDLILGDVEFHEDLICKGRERNKTVGGGRWHFDRSNNTIYFWGKSVDFGQVTEKQFEESFKQPSVEDANVVFSHKMNFIDVLKEIEENCNKSE